MTISDTKFSAPISAASGNISAGTCVCPQLNADTYVIATDAAFAAVGRMGGVAITLGAPQTSIIVQYSGELDASITGLGVGAAAPVKRGSAGQLQRVVGTPLSTDYILGDCDTNGGMTFRSVSFIAPPGGAITVGNGIVPILNVNTINLYGSLAANEGFGGLVSLSDNFKLIDVSADSVVQKYFRAFVRTNFSGEGITVSLPLLAEVGDWVEVCDSDGNAADNPFNVNDESGRSLLDPATRTMVTNVAWGASYQCIRWTLVNNGTNNVWIIQGGW